MPLVKWSNDFDIRLTRFDEQHKHLIGLLNKVYDNFTDGHSGGQTESILNEIIAYSQDHFKEEEYVMTSIEYPHLEKHKDEHAHFTKRANHLKSLFDSGISSLDNEMLVFLNGWMSFHIQKEDVTMGDFFYKYVQTIKGDLSS